MAPPFEDIIFDAKMLHKINNQLPRIHIPTWIKRAIPALGKASFGKLKADEWRNLLTIQLPLILIPLWSGSDQVNESLLKNLCHLVLLVNLALKRKMNSSHIQNYRQHIRCYLESSIALFSHSNLAPNHHMAMHLADCLERFGPVRAWWSFPFEHLMGSVLKACHNNHVGECVNLHKNRPRSLTYHSLRLNLGELKITFMKTYCRAGNLSGLLTDQKIPKTLKPHVERLQAIIDGPKKKERRLSNSRLDPLDEDVLKLLVNHLNDTKSERVKWVLPDEWCSMSNREIEGHTPVHGRAFFHKSIENMDVTFCTFTENPNNSFIMFKRRGALLFGRIFSIFMHRRTPSPTSSQSIMETWLKVQCFPSILKRAYDPFSSIDSSVQAHLRAWGPTQDILIKLCDIVAHCAWFMYKPGELHPKIGYPTVGLVCMAR